MSAYLLMYEYKRHLQEAMFSNKMLWVLNLVAELVTVAALYKIYFQSWFMGISALFAVFFNGTLVVLMVMTKRPVYEEGITLPVENVAAEPLIKKKGCCLEVRF